MDPGHLLTSLAQCFVFQCQMFLLVPAFGDLGLWEGMGGSSIFLFSLSWLYLRLEDNCSSVSLLVVGTFFIVLSVVQPLSTFVTVGGCWSR